MGYGGQSWVTVVSLGRTQFPDQAFYPLPIHLPAFLGTTSATEGTPASVNRLCLPWSSQNSGQSWVSSSITTPLRYFGDRVSPLNQEQNNLARLAVQSSRTHVCFHTAGITSMSGRSTVSLGAADLNSRFSFVQQALSDRAIPYSPLHTFHYWFCNVLFYTLFNLLFKHIIFISR